MVGKNTYRQKLESNVFYIFQRGAAVQMMPSA